MGARAKMQAVIGVRCAPNAFAVALEIPASDCAPMQ
jgi:hypothetical protein